jgi:hypothetical protein
MVAAIQRAGGHPGYTEYPDVGHPCWDLVYADPTVLRWIFSH